MFKGQKFSKSRRVGVWIDEALKLYPADYWRYTLISIRPEVRDTSFTWEVFIEKVNSDLNDTLGNFIHRTLTFIHRYYDSRIPQPEKLDEYDKDVLENILKFKVELEDSMENFKLQNFILTTINLARLANKYINDKEPWKIVKENPEKAASTLWVATQIVKALATFLQPIIPQTSNKIWETLGLKNKSIQQWDGIIEKIKAGHKINKPKPLFKKVTLPETE